jgi:hypothetical protein
MSRKEPVPPEKDGLFEVLLPPRSDQKESRNPRRADQVLNRVSHWPYDG